MNHSIVDTTLDKVYEEVSKKDNFLFSFRDNTYVPRLLTFYSDNTYTIHYSHSPAFYGEWFIACDIIYKTGDAFLGLTSRLFEDQRDIEIAKAIEQRLFEKEFENQFLLKS